MKTTLTVSIIGETFDGTRMIWHTEQGWIGRDTCRDDGTCTTWDSEDGATRYIDASIADALKDDIRNPRIDVVLVDVEDENEE